jgi:SAM-dependent methyltransferase
MLLVPHARAAVTSAAAAAEKRFGIAPWNHKSRRDVATGPGARATPALGTLQLGSEMFAKADAYERFMGRWSRGLARFFVAFCDVQDGDAVLDVGSGTGALSFALRESTNASRITGVDPSADYVRHAAGATTDPRLRFEVGDAARLAFSDASFDKTLSALVLNFVPEPGRAVREMSRVTKPRGVVAAAVWDYGDGMEMLRAFWDEAVALDPAASTRDEARMPLCRKGDLAAWLAREGLEDVRDAELTTTLSFASFDDYWEPFLLGQGPAGAYAAGLPHEARDALRERLRARWLRGGPDRPIDMRARAWAAKGSVPPHPGLPSTRGAESTGV